MHAHVCRCTTLVKCGAQQYVGSWSLGTTCSSFMSISSVIRLVPVNTIFLCVLAILWPPALVLVRKGWSREFAIASLLLFGAFLCVGLVILVSLISVDAGAYMAMHLWPYLDYLVRVGYILSILYALYIVWKTHPATGTAAHVADVDLEEQMLAYHSASVYSDDQP